MGKQTAGVFISMAEEITVSHNTVFRVPRAGICINDGTWGGHVIEFNDVFDTVRETGDHGPFNSWGRDRWWKTSYNEGGPLDPCARSRATLDAWKTTHIRNNRFAHPAGGHSWGIGLDDGSSNYHIYDNLTLNMGVKLREGFFRRVENNVIVNGFGGFHIWVPGSDDVVARNVIVDSAPYRSACSSPRSSGRSQWRGARLQLCAERAPGRASRPRSRSVSRLLEAKPRSRGDLGAPSFIASWRTRAHQSRSALTAETPSKTRSTFVLRGPII
jgi:hypothetical protein